MAVTKHFTVFVFSADFPKDLIKTTAKKANQARENTRREYRQKHSVPPDLGLYTEIVFVSPSEAENDVFHKACMEALTEGVEP